MERRKEADLATLLYTNILILFKANRPHIQNYSFVLLLLPQFCWFFQHRVARDKKKGLGPFYTFEITIENKYKSNSCKHMWEPYKILRKWNFHLLKWWMVMNKRNRLHFTLVTTWDFWISVQHMIVSSVSVLCFLTFYWCVKVWTSRIRKLSWWCLLLLLISNSTDLWPHPLSGIATLIEKAFLYFSRREVSRQKGPFPFSF